MSDLLVACPSCVPGPRGCRYISYVAHGETRCLLCNAADFGVLTSRYVCPEVAAAFRLGSWMAVRELVSTSQPNTNYWQWRLNNRMGDEWHKGFARAKGQL